MKQLAKKAYETPDVSVKLLAFEDVITSSPQGDDYITAPGNWDESFWGGNK